MLQLFVLWAKTSPRAHRKTAVNAQCRATTKSRSYASMGAACCVQAATCSHISFMPKAPCASKFTALWCGPGTPDLKQLLLKRHQSLGPIGPPIRNLVAILLRFSTAMPPPAKRPKRCYGGCNSKSKVFCMRLVSLAHVFHCQSVPGMCPAEALEPEEDYDDNRKIKFMMVPSF